MTGLFSPITVRGLTLRNRLVMPPMANSMATETGEATRKHVDHYLARARAGVGLIVVEHAYIAMSGRVRTTQLGAYSDDLVPGLARLAAAVHETGAAIAMQINHAGAKATLAVSGSQPTGPSDIAPPGAMEQPRPMTGDEIAGLVDAFAAAARRCKQAGFDAVEVHGAHGYLLSQFTSPLTNRRTDRYGGAVARRLRFPCEAIAAVRAVVGPDYPVLYRFGAIDMVEGGLTQEDACRLAPVLVEAGVDVLDVSGGLGGAGSDRFTQQGYFVELASSIRKASGAPVVGIGNIREAGYADRAVREGMVDMVAVGRAQLEDPDWAAKARVTLGVRD
jgi:NADPH2 dehydrogenase